MRTEEHHNEGAVCRTVIYTRLRAWRAESRAEPPSNGNTRSGSAPPDTSSIPPCPTALSDYYTAHVANLGILIEINPPENLGNAPEASELTTQSLHGNIKHAANKTQRVLDCINIFFQLIPEEVCFILTELL